MLRRIATLLLCGALLLPTLQAAASAPAPRTVTIAPSKTSIYVGSVTLTPTVFTRKDASYAGSYTAKVVPFFFQSEKGEVRIDVPEAELARLARGEPVDFHGEARTDKGETRRVEGRATPADATGGKMKLRIFVTKKIELIFNTTYRLSE